MSDLKTGAQFPTDHPAHIVAPFNALSKTAREIVCESDVILSLDWVDLGGLIKQASNVGKVSAKVIAATLDHTLHTGSRHGIPVAAAARRLHANHLRHRRRRTERRAGPLLFAFPP